jgi:hypothetical protein
MATKIEAGKGHVYFGHWGKEVQEIVNQKRLVQPQIYGQKILQIVALKIFVAVLIVFLSPCNVFNLLLSAYAIF